MRLRGVAGIVLVYLAVAAINLSFHWYAGSSKSALARLLLNVYLYPQDHPRSQIAFLGIDFLGPTVILGIAAGTIGSKWRDATLGFSVIALSVGWAVLYPIRATLFPEATRLLLGHPVSAFNLCVGVALQTVFGAMYCGVAACVASSRARNAFARQHPLKLKALGPAGIVGEPDGGRPQTIAWSDVRKVTVRKSRQGQQSLDLQSRTGVCLAIVEIASDMDLGAVLEQIERWHGKRPVRENLK